MTPVGAAFGRSQSLPPTGGKVASPQAMTDEGAFAARRVAAPYRAP